MNRFALASIATALAIASQIASARLPAPPPQTDEQKAKAAEAAKKDAELLAKYQDRAVANYRKNQGSRSGSAAAEKKPKKSK